jgi:hypothetical protein
MRRALPSGESEIFVCSLFVSRKLNLRQPQTPSCLLPPCRPLFGSRACEFRCLFSFSLTNHSSVVLSSRDLSTACDLPVSSSFNGFSALLTRHLFISREEGKCNCPAPTDVFADAHSGPRLDSTRFQHGDEILANPSESPQDHVGQ